MSQNPPREISQGTVQDPVVTEWDRDPSSTLREVEVWGLLFGVTAMIALVQELV